MSRPAKYPYPYRRGSAVIVSTPDRRAYQRVRTAYYHRGANFGHVVQCHRLSEIALVVTRMT